MNGMAKAGGILLIIASAFGIINGLFVTLLFGGFSTLLLILGVAVTAISILMIIWCAGYMSNGSKKILLVVLSIICAVLSIPGIISIILYVLAAVFIALGKEKVE